jgi:hypothetical protein
LGLLLAAPLAVIFTVIVVLLPRGEANSQNNGAPAVNDNADPPATL